MIKRDIIAILDYFVFTLKLCIFTAHGVVDYRFANLVNVWKSSGKPGDQWVKIALRLPDILLLYELLNFCQNSPFHYDLAFRVEVRLELALFRYKPQCFF